MSDCQLCGLKDSKEIIYEDDKVAAVLSPEPAALGHIILFPKTHYQIIEQIPDYEFGHLLSIANKLSTAAFESIGAQGTNIIIQNGVDANQEIPHVSVHIIPRRENDGIDFQWLPKQLTEEQMSTVELQLKEGAKDVGAFQMAPKSEPIKLDKKPEAIVLTKEENYLIKQLRRIP